jgi:monooxygenase
MPARARVGQISFAMATIADPVLEHVDVLIVGAGLSGVGAACHLQIQCPGRTFLVLEARAVSGGTWDLFRYPGIRSDSDMFTLGYPFRPWLGPRAIADGASILGYLRDTARAYRIDEKIRYHRRVRRASWSSSAARWTVEVERTDTAVVERLTCNFLFANTGYYRYDQGYTPEFTGRADFAGPVLHPQAWPADLDVQGRRVVVIGSGATAITLAPALARLGAEVTIVQRSPSYVLALAARDPLARVLQRTLPARTAYRLIRGKNVLLSTLMYQLSRRRPELIKALLRRSVERLLPPGYDVDTHFSPRYQPWDQRLGVSPNGDLFRAIHNGQVTMVTDTIERFTEKGLRLASGADLAADMIVTATGLNLLMLGGLTLDIDGEPVDFAERVGYQGMMFSGIPNLAVTFGYTNASWTLKGDLTADWVCRLLNHLTAHGHRQVRPRGPDPGRPTRPFLDLTSGYVQRSRDALPRQGLTAPWRQHQNYPRDLLRLRYAPLTTKYLDFS